LKLKILITFALDVEFAPWRSLHPFVKVANHNIHSGVYEGRFGEAQVQVALTGIGGVNAKKAARAALQWKPDVCISSGLAGSLRVDFPIGQICAASEVVELETGRSVGAHLEMLRRAERHGAMIIAKLLTSADMILSSEGKSRLGKMGEAVEMESFAVMSEAAAAGVPGISIRAISDAADEDLPMDFGSMLDDGGNVNASKVAKAVARAPHKLPALMRLAKNSRLASKKLAGFLEAYVAGLPASSKAPAQLAEARRA
jgi:adenosylhomocysteine nucleosidase